MSLKSDMVPRLHSPNARLEPQYGEKTLFCSNLQNFYFSGREKQPNLVELGPFVYRQKLIKTDTKFSADGEEITHSVYREYYFDETLSI